MTTQHRLRGALHLARSAARLGPKPIQLTHMIRDRTESAIETMPCRQALFEEAQFDRIRAVPRTTPSEQVARLWQIRQRWHEAQYHEFGPAYVIGGEIYADGKCVWVPSSPPPRRPLPIEVIDEPVVLTNSAAGMRYFGHWARDDCSAYVVARDDGRGRLLSLKRRNWPDIPFYEGVFGQTWDEKEAFWTPNLSLITDMGFSPSKRDRMESFRGKLREQISASDPGKIVYLMRGPSAVSRGLQNEDELVAALEAKGIPIVTAEIDTPELLAQLMDAKMVITVEGSQTTHATWTIAKTGALMVLQPPQRFYNPHLEWTRMFDIPYGIVIGEPRGNDGFHIYPDEVFAMADRLLAEVGG